MVHFTLLILMGGMLACSSSSKKDDDKKNVNPVASQYAIFVDMHQIEETNILYKYDILKKKITKLSRDVVAEGGIWMASISPDGSSVLYGGRIESTALSSVFVISENGTDEVKVFQETPENNLSIQSDVIWSPDGKYLAVILNSDDDFLKHLYTMKKDGTAFKQVDNVPITSGNGVDVFKWTSRGQLVYRTDQTVSGAKELFVVNKDGTGNERVSAEFAAGNILDYYYQISPDGTKVAYVSSVNAAGAHELFVADINGGGVINVSGELTMSGDVKKDSYAWSPDGSKLFYVADQNVSGRYELFVVNANSSQRAAVSGVLAAGQSVEPETAQWSPDGSKIAFGANLANDDRIDLYVVNVDDANRTQVSNVAVDDGEINTRPVWSSDSKKLLYRADATQDTVDELFVVDSNGENHVSIHGDLTADTYIATDFGWLPGDEKVMSLFESDEIGGTSLIMTDRDGKNQIDLTAEFGEGRFIACLAIKGIKSQNKCELPS